MLESINRDFNYEKKLLDELLKLNFVNKVKYFAFDKKETNKYNFMEYMIEIIPVLKKIGFSIKNNLFLNEINIIKPEINTQINKKQDWFDLNITVVFGKFKIPFHKLQKHILEENSEYILPDNSIAIIPNEWFAELRPFAKRSSKDGVYIHNSSYFLIDESDIILPSSNVTKLAAANNGNEKVELPNSNIATLRDYQKEGYYWLYNATKNNIGVCLADEMGLGKTVQIITLLKSFFENKNTKSKAETSAKQIQLSLFDNLINDTGNNTLDSETCQSALIIVPRSLIFNWIDELKKFAPEITYAVYYGTNRKQILEKNLHQTHLLISTYGVIRQDIEILEDIKFSFVILDEAHYIKNPSSKIYKAIIQLEAENRISITGTPIENSLTDLWAQMNFLNDNMLGNFSYFKNEYIDAIVSNNFAPEIKELQKIIKPLILRRLKKDVAKELPEKTEIIVFNEMEESQRILYEEKKSSIRNAILFGNKKQGYIHAIAILNELRQIVLHPKLTDDKYQFMSGKYETIINIVENLLAEGHKFLIFSSFVKHLNIYKEYFEANNIEYSMLTGKDKNRQKIVEDYQNNEKIKPFLISIKAGGQGLNITSANYVLIIDPWWNPFVEQQAIDRTHRIGQTKNVFVYKFITKNTIEEKIQELQKSKINLSESLISERFNKLSVDDIEKLI